MVPETDHNPPRGQGQPIDHTCREKVAIMNEAVFGLKCNATIESVTASWVKLQIIDIPTNVSYSYGMEHHSGPAGRSATSSVSAGFSFGVQTVSGSTSKSISQSTASTFA